MDDTGTELKEDDTLDTDAELTAGQTVAGGNAGDTEPSVRDGVAGTGGTTLFNETGAGKHVPRGTATLDGRTFIQIAMMVAYTPPPRSSDEMRRANIP